MANPIHNTTAQDARPKVLNPVKARQGFLDRPVLVVLISSLVLLVLGFAGVFMGFW